MFKPRWKKRAMMSYIKATVKAAKVATLRFECQADTWRALCSVGEIGFDEVAPERIEETGGGIVSVELTGMEVLRLLEAYYDEMMATGQRGETLYRAMYAEAERGASTVVRELYYNMVDALLAEADNPDSPLSYRRVIEMSPSTTTP